MIGTSPEIIDLFQEVERVARSDAKVLVTGESGVGKELVARAVHDFSPRARQPFVAVNCAGMPETLLESELFGHVKGSFTGAYRDKPGKVEQADQGTLFLDEVGEMTLRMQGLLLRFLETGEVQKVGSDSTAGIANVRVIAATNRRLPELITQGLFREDLFYRLNVIHLQVPPLRERKEDILLLVDHFLERFTRSGTSVVRDITSGARSALVKYHWPGNIRELANVIERLVVVGRSATIDEHDLPADIRSPRPAHEQAATAGTPPLENPSADLYKRLVDDGESFWTSVYPLYMRREITRSHVREVVKRGLSETRGNYKIVVSLFNMEPTDYKKFLNFLRKHDCQLPFQEFRQA
jgi:two-component system response regulator AtoC